MPGPVPAIPHGAPASLLPTATAALIAPSRAALFEPWVTRDDGTFRASPASPGRVRAIVRHPQYVEAQSEVVTLVPGGEGHVEVVLSEGGALEGRVFDFRDRPVAGARIIAAALRGSLERLTRSASDGSFAFAALPDAIVLTAGGDDEEEVRMEIAIPEKGRKEITVHLPEPREALAVTVVDERDFPVATAQVSVSSLSPEAPLRTTAFTDAHGEATLKHAAGLPVRIEVIAPGHAPKVVASDGGAAALRVALAPAESATGEVVSGPRREPVAAAGGILYKVLRVRWVRCDPEGEFSITGLAPGPASLRVRAQGFAPFADSVTIPDTEGRRPFAVARVELAVEAVVEGEVLDARGKPVAGARVAKDHVPTWLVASLAGPHARDGEGFVLTDSSGRFSLGELPEGDVSLEAYSPEAGRGRVEAVKVVSGRTTTRVRIEIAPPDGSTREPVASGSVAVTLGETGTPVEVQIVSVADGSEAERGGLAPGDTIVTVDGAGVTSMQEARTRMSGPIADDVIVQVRRGGELRALRVAREAVRR